MVTSLDGLSVLEGNCRLSPLVLLRDIAQQANKIYDGQLVSAGADAIWVLMRVVAESVGMFYKITMMLPDLLVRH